MIEVSRKPHLAEKIVIVNGHPGCGKTMFSPIIAALERVELFVHPYELEYICSLYYLGKIDLNAASVMVRLLTDQRLYDTMMSREVNFRPSDLSSAFRDVNPGRYLRRLFQKGDEAVPAKVKKERPILHLTTHDQLPYSEPVFSGLGKRVVFIEVVRHPLYMIIQQALNMDRLFQGDVRSFCVYFNYNNQELPYFAKDYEKLFISSNAMEKTIYLMQKAFRESSRKQRYLENKYNATIITVPFEQFVIDPWPYLKEIEDKLETKVSKATLKMMKKQRVPRKKFAAGPGFKIYKHCGWQPSEAQLDEQGEFEKRRQIAKKQASKEAMSVLDELCIEYEEKYMRGLKRKGENYE